MNMNDAPRTSVADPADRSHIYHALGDAFRYPHRDRYDALQGGDYLKDLLATLDRLAHARLSTAEQKAAKTALDQALGSLAFADFENAYILTFDAGAPQPPCPPYEGAFRDGIPRAKRMLAVTAFYRHFGLKMSEEEGKRDLPDHLGAELEFMHFLTFKEAQAREAADEELVIGYVHAQRDFLARHLSRWLPQFAAKLEGTVQCAAFAVLARIAEGFVTRELALVNDYLKAWGVPEDAEPPEPEQSPFPPIVPAEGGCCPPPPDC